MQCGGNVTMENIYQTEDEIKDRLDDIFPEGRVYTQFEVKDLHESMFDQDTNGLPLDVPTNEKVAALVLYSGFSVTGQAARRHSNIKMLWRVLVVTPSELYKDNAGGKILEVIKRLRGEIPFRNGKDIQLESDVREFNEPDFVNNMFAIPAVFSIEVTI